MGDPGRLAELPDLLALLPQGGSDREQSAPADGIVCGLDAMADLALDQRLTVHPQGHGPSISASQFKARCLKLMDQVAASGETLLITKNGRPEAELHPCRPQRRRRPFCLHSTAVLHGGGHQPLNEPWVALR